MLAGERAARRRLAVFYFVYFTLLGSYAPYFGLYLKSLGFSAWHIGVLLSLVPLVRIVMPVLWAAAAEAGGRHRQVLRVSTWGAVGSAAALNFVQSFWGLFAVLLLLNVLWCAALPLVESATLSRLRERPGDYGRIRVWGSVSFVLAVVCLGALVERWGPGVLCPALALLFAANALAAWGVPFDAPTGPVAATGPWLQALRRRDVVALLAGCFLMAVAHGPYYTFFSIYLVEQGYSKATVGLLWGLAVVAEVGVFLWLPQLMRRFSLRALLVGSFLLAALRFIVIGAWPGLILLTVLAQLLHAASFGAHHAAALAAIHAAFPGPHRARAQALYSGIGFGAGGAVGGLLSGWLWGSAGALATFCLGALAALCGLLVILVGFHPARAQRL